MLAALAATTGCRRGEAPRYLERVALADTEAIRQLAARGITADEVAAGAGRALAGAAGLQQGPAPEGAARFLARVSVHRADAVVVGSDGQPVARVVVTLELVPAGDAPPVREVALGTEPLGSAATGVDRALRAGLQHAVDEAARQIALHLQASAKTESALVRDLSAADPATRDHAVRVLAERRNPAAIPGLIERLRDADPDVADRAVGALAEIGDPRAVEPLVDLAHRRGGRALEQIVRIVGDIGGPKAKAWLETLAAGHPDAEVRAAAEESLEVLRRRAEPNARAAASR